MAAVLICSCDEEIEQHNEESKSAVTFHLMGDFSSPTFTRALSANGSEMKELWAFDIVNGDNVNYVCQTSDDNDFGSPTLTMANGEHTVCFVVSRGDGYTIDDNDNVLEWSRPSDTFWGSLTVNVSPTSERELEVKLDRVTTKLKIAITDEIPDNVASVVLTPATWYYGLNYLTGAATEGKINEQRTVNVPSSYHGTSGQLAVSIFGLSDAGEWTTDVTVTAKDDDGGIISTVAIADAPFMANRQTVYSGQIFSNNGAFSLSLDDEWHTDYIGTW